MNLLPAITGSRGEIAPLLNKVHHCDALDLLRRLPDQSVDMVLCDLPYGVTACEWDTVIPIEPMWKELRRVAKKRAAIVLTATQPFTSRLVSSNYEMFRYEWVWVKAKATNPLNAYRMPMKKHESVLVFAVNFCDYYPIMRKREDSSNRYNRPLNYSKNNKQIEYLNAERISKKKMPELKVPDSVINFHLSVSEFGLHPTQKPVALFEYLIKTYTQPGEIVLDMTCGSGTTAIAARKCNRQFICGDLSAEYVEVARKRLQNSDPFQATILPDGRKQLSLFEHVS